MIHHPEGAQQRRRAGRASAVPDAADGDPAGQPAAQPNRAQEVQQQQLRQPCGPDGAVSELPADAWVVPSLAAAGPAEIEAAYAAMVESEDYPCVGAKSALHRNRVQVTVLDRMADTTVTPQLHRALAQFSAGHPAEADRGLPMPRFASFLAVFRAPIAATEEAFEELLWRQLSMLHEVDDVPWDEGVSRDPANPHFGMSVAGRAFFVIGMHPHASRLARRAPLPTLVFNLHSQFDQLRTGDRYDRLRDTVRRRDVALQGSVNPMADDFGARSEARQYSGRRVPDDWTPPYDFGHPSPAVTA